MKTEKLTILDLLDRLDASRTLQPALRQIDSEDRISNQLRTELQAIQARIAELEQPKTCATCEYENVNYGGCYECAAKFKSYHTPKAQQ